MNRFIALCTGLVLTVAAFSPAAAQTHFVECGIEEGNINNATIVVPTASTPDINGSALSIGSEIAVFKAGTDQCAGSQVWNDANTTVTVRGDDDQTGQVEGLVAGDSMVFRVWDSLTGLEFSGETVQFAYDPNSGLNTSGLYTNDGLYVLADISVVDESLLPPEAPALSAPADEAADIPLTADLIWFSVENAATYHVQVDEEPEFGSPVFEATDLADTTASVDGFDYQTTYFWRVRAAGGDGPGDWSSVRSFSTVLPPAPATPMLTAPDDEATGVSMNADLEWSSVEFADGYDVEVDDDLDFSSPTYASTDQADTTAVTSGLSNGTLYFWRVRALGPGGSGDWSPARSFTTALDPAPDPPVLALPTDDAENVARSVLLDWDASDGADTYRVQLSGDASFGETILDAADVDSTSILASDLDYYTEYFWRVRATGAGGSGSWSVINSFSTEQLPAPAAPVLLTPADDATDVPPGVELDWAGVPGADSYQVQLDDDAAFGTPALDESGLETTSAETAGLANAVTYHWRVRAVGPGGNGPWSVVRSFTTASEDAPDAPALVSPADDEADLALNVTLAWNAVDLADSYRLQLDDNDDFSSPVRDQGDVTATTYDVTGLDFMTTYHWRVRADGDGGHGAWSVVRSFTTLLPPPPGTPTPLLPSDGRTGVSVSASIDWSTVDGANSYDLQIHTDDGFASPFLDFQGLEASAKIAAGLEPVTEYFWRVRARGPGGAGSWSTVRSFTTEQFADIDPPALISPESEMPGVPANATLTWSAVGGAQLYHVQVDENAAFISPDFENNTLTVTSTVTSPLTASTHYYWRVRGSGADGNGPWSEARRFLTRPDPPELLTPTADSVGVSTNAVFTWAESDGADRYYFQLDDDPNFASPRLNLNGVGMLNAAAPGLESNTVYHWRVRASKNTGLGPWSPVRSFTTGLVQAPATPVTTTPADGAVDVSTTVILEWTTPPGAQRYRWQLDDDPAFGSPVIFAQNHQGNTAAVPGLAYLKTYYWRVQAVNEGGASFWSETASFRTIQITPPAAPGIVAPFYGQQNVSARPTLSWSASARSTAYEVQVDDTFGFSSPEFHSDDISATGVSASGLRSETFYYWRVRGLNEGGVSPWSAVGFFTTEYVEIPSSPALVYPLNDAVGFTASVLLDWSVVDGAYGYHLQVDDDPAFASPVMDDEQIPSQSIEVTGLSPNTTYSWRVRASNPGGFSLWSDARTFRTAPGAPAMLAPTDGAVDIRVDQPFEWSDSDGATSYRIQIAANDAFTDPLVDQEGPDLSFSFGDVVLDNDSEYWWRVRAVSESGQSDWGESFGFTTGAFLSVAVEDDHLLPDRVRLDPGYPNPFSRSTTFELHLPAASSVVMKVFDMLGREVGHLVEGSLPSGTHRVEWTPERLSSGVYIAFAVVDGRSISRMVTLTR